MTERNITVSLFSGVLFVSAIEVTAGQNGNLESLKEQKVSLRFTLSDARLYSYRLGK